MNRYEPFFDRCPTSKTLVSEVRKFTVRHAARKPQMPTLPRRRAVKGMVSYSIKMISESNCSNCINASDCIRSRTCLSDSCKFKHSQMHDRTRSKHFEAIFLVENPYDCRFANLNGALAGTTRFKSAVCGCHNSGASVEKILKLRADKLPQKYRYITQSWAIVKDFSEYPKTFWTAYSF